MTWTRDGKGWGFDSDKGSEAFAAAARDHATAGQALGQARRCAGGAEPASTVVEAEYRCDFVYHAQMEPLNAVAAVSPHGDACELWSGVQSKTMAVTVAADALGITPDKVVLHDMLMGGGFGRRGHRDMEFVHDAVVLSKAVRKPVKVMWTREDDVHNGRFYPLSAHYLRAGFDAAGKLVAIHHRKACDQVTAFQDPVCFERRKGRDAISFTGIECPYYAIPNHLARGRAAG